MLKHSEIEARCIGGSGPLCFCLGGLLAEPCFLKAASWLIAEPSHNSRLYLGQTSGTLQVPISLVGVQAGRSGGSNVEALAIQAWNDGRGG